MWACGRLLLPLRHSSINDRDNARVVHILGVRIAFFVTRGAFFSARSGRVGGFYSPSAIRRHNGRGKARVVHIFVGRIAFFGTRGAFLRGGRYLSTRRKMTT